MDARRLLRVFLRSSLRWSLAILFASQSVSVSVSYQFLTHHPALTASFVHRVVYMLGSEDICTLVLYYRDISW